MQDMGMRAALAVTIVIGMLAMPVDAKSARAKAGEPSAGMLLRQMPVAGGFR